MRVLTCVRALLLLAAMLLGATSVHAQAVSSQGTWETTLLGRDINLNAVAATSASAVYLYDTSLNVTWLRDANVNGAMDWTAANAWAANLVTGNGTTAISDWRLPIMAANPNPNYSYDGSSATGHNVPASSSEMASLYFNTLGNISYADINGHFPQAGSGLTNTGSFQNLQSNLYWSGTEYASDTNEAWYFYNQNGSQNYNLTKDYRLYAMAVRSGDVGSLVTPVPEPETYAMLLAGLGLIGAVARRRNSGSASRSTPCES